jgi:hypothetical protein
LTNSIHPVSAAHQNDYTLRKKCGRLRESPEAQMPQSNHDFHTRTHFGRVKSLWIPNSIFGPKYISPGKEFLSHVEAYQSAHGARS